MYNCSITISLTLIAINAINFYKMKFHIFVYCINVQFKTVCVLNLGLRVRIKVTILLKLRRFIE